MTRTQLLRSAAGVGSKALREMLKVTMADPLLLPTNYQSFILSLFPFTRVTQTSNEWGGSSRLVLFLPLLVKISLAPRERSGVYRGRYATKQMLVDLFKKLRTHFISRTGGSEEFSNFSSGCGSTATPGVEGFYTADGSQTAQHVSGAGGGT